MLRRILQVNIFAIFEIVILACEIFNLKPLISECVTLMWLCITLVSFFIILIQVMNKYLHFFCLSFVCKHLQCTSILRRNWIRTIAFFDRVGMCIKLLQYWAFYDRDFVSLHCLQRLRATFANIPLIRPLINQDFQILKHYVMYVVNSR